MNFADFSRFFKKPLIIIFLLGPFLLSSCIKEKSDPITGKSENEKFEPNSDARARKYADENPIMFFGDRGKKNNNTQNFEFAGNNVLWRATLKTLDFLPIQSVDYAGGIIIYDWYAKDGNSNEFIKVSVQFLSSDLKSDSIKIMAYKKICDNSDKCKNSPVDASFPASIKEDIIFTARSLNIEEVKKNKK